MAQTITCAHCGDTSPADARFCIGCGSSFAEATTGPTVKLNGLVCQVCHTPNPKDARFCVACGRPMGASAGAQPRPQPRPQPQPSFRPTPVRPAPRVYPRVQPHVIITPRPAPTPRPSTNTGMFVLVIGTLFLLATKTFWPGILLLMLLSFFVQRSVSGRGLPGIMPLFWILGIFFLLAKGLFWPGILVLWMLSWIVGSMSGGHRHHW